MIPRVTATIDLGALRHNLARVRQLAPHSKVMAAIKADAYGHGAVPVARALEDGVDSFAVAALEEALVLREAHVRARIALLEGILSSEEAKLCLRHELEVVVNDHWQLALLEALPRGARVSLWIKLDSGMHRLGFPLADVPGLMQRIRARSDWDFRGWITHLARADEPDQPATREQVGAFTHALQGLPGARSIANSAGLIAWPEARADWVRPGLMLYGASPLPGRDAAELGLQPAMSLASRLIAVRNYSRGAAIGYGGAYRCPEDMAVGVVSIGYADGFHRSLPTGTPVLVHGRRVPMIGRVSMDMITIDLRQGREAKVGDPVTLWGPGLPIEEVAAMAGTVAYELLCGLTQRVRFVHS
ncbi:MAG TPA: alanine racemase [Verrucomicrobiae bacterium]|nr:alanine racemase [Verrucomicrobiae bacterium]